MKGVNAFDLFVLANALGCFWLYIIFHLVLFRFSRATSVITWLVKAFLVLGLVNVGLSLALKMAGLIPSYGLGPDVFGFGVSFSLYGILCFSYVICFVGPYETSVRTRIVRELYGAPQGMTIQQLRQRYDNKIILDLRLNRLLASKDLVFDGKVYQDSRGKSVFTGITALSNFLKSCYGV